MRKANSRLIALFVLTYSTVILVTLVLWLRSRSKADDAERLQDSTNGNSPATQPTSGSQRVPIEVSRVAPELRKPMRMVTRLAFPIEIAWGRRAAFTFLTLMPSGKLDGVKIEQRRTADVSVRVYHPLIRRSTAALFRIHGGGLVMGRAVQDDRTCALTAQELGILVVSVEYRKAPEHPFPAALDDCVAGWHWLQLEAMHLDVDPTRIAIGGESAGGGLAASLVQQLHDTDETAPVAQWLFCPMLDDRTAAKRELDGVNHFVWNNSLNRFGWQSYLSAEPGSECVPAYAVPSRREDLRGLPRTWIGVGDIDLFLVSGYNRCSREHRTDVQPCTNKLAERNTTVLV